jgi:hypothetical protein
MIATLWLDKDAGGWCHKIRDDPVRSRVTFTGLGKNFRACRRLTARAKFARTCFRPAISPMLKPKEIHNPISPVENEDWTNDFDTCVECEANV